MIGILILLFLSGLGHSTSRLKVGDILLQPLNCWVCSLIEAEERTIYSHMGIVLQTSPEILVGEAWGVVRAVPLQEFRTKTQTGERLRVLRFLDNVQGSLLQQTFSEFFDGRNYDEQFSWDNVDESGEELYYCSEMIAKLLSRVTRIPMPIKTMTYEQNREHWSRYFNGNIPDQLPGNSPADFHRSPLFQDLGKL